MPLAERLVTDEFSPQEREAVRTMVGESPFFSFAANLAKLCGEGARVTVAEHEHLGQENKLLR